MLTLERGVGRSIYIGNDATLVVVAVRRQGRDDDASAGDFCTVSVVAPETTAVTNDTTAVAEHARRQAAAERAGIDDMASHEVTLSRGGGFLMGRGITVMLQDFSREGAVLGISAPRHVAISRDDFSLEEHRAFQAQRDAQPGPAPGRR